MRRKIRSRKRKKKKCYIRRKWKETLQKLIRARFRLRRRRKGKRRRRRWRRRPNNGDPKAEVFPGVSGAALRRPRRRRRRQQSTFDPSRGKHQKHFFYCLGERKGTLWVLFEVLILFFGLCYFSFIVFFSLCLSPSLFTYTSNFKNLLFRGLENGICGDDPFDSRRMFFFFYHFSFNYLFITYVYRRDSQFCHWHVGIDVNPINAFFN